MGAGGMYPNNPYSTDYTGHSYPYYNQDGYSTPNHHHHHHHQIPPYHHIPPHVYPPNHIPPYVHPPTYGRGYQRPYYPTTNGFHHDMFLNQLGVRAAFDASRTGAGNLPSAPPNGNMQSNRPGEH